MRRTETPKPIWIKFCMVVDIPDIVTYTNFADHRLRGFWVAGGQISPSHIDFHRRPYNTLALPCERVIVPIMSSCYAMAPMRQLKGWCGSRPTNWRSFVTMRALFCLPPDSDVTARLWIRRLLITDRPTVWNVNRCHLGLQASSALHPHGSLQALMQRAAASNAARHCSRLYIGWQWRNCVPYLCQLIFAAIL